jgi:hypothetical protein
MPEPKKTHPRVRRARVVARIPVSLRDRLSQYCASTGQSERLVLERALEVTLDRETDTARVLKRIDALERTVHEQGRDLQLLSEAFGRYLRVWILAHHSQLVRPPKGAQPSAERFPTAPEIEARYKEFVAVIAKHFFSGHRFIDDLPEELVASE